MCSDIIVVYLWQRMFLRANDWAVQGIFGIKSKCLSLEKENEKLQEQLNQVADIEKENDLLRQRCEDLTVQTSKNEAEIEKLAKEGEERATKAAEELSRVETEIVQLKEANMNLQNRVSEHDLKVTRLNAEHVQILAAQVGKMAEIDKIRSRLSQENFQQFMEMSSLRRLNSSLKTDIIQQVAKVKELVRENRRLYDLSTELEEEKTKLLQDLGNFEDANHLAFVNCIQQLQHLNPGICLNLKGLSPSHIIENNKLIDLVNS